MKKVLQTAVSWNLGGEGVFLLIWLSSCLLGNLEGKRRVCFDEILLRNPCDIITLVSESKFRTVQVGVLCHLLLK
jgi:hypothetical protein